MQATDVLIIGAGISGLICATELRKADKSVRILDKSHGLGGRMATRRMSGGRLDHGAQYFTVRDPRLQVYADDWLAEGIIKEWFRHLPEDTNTDGYTRYCGINGMTDVPKHLAEKLDVCNSQQVIEKLISEGSMLILPGTMFGPDKNQVLEQTFRVAFANIELNGIKEFVDRFRKISWY